MRVRQGVGRLGRLMGIVIGTAGAIWSSGAAAQGLGTPASPPAAAPVTVTRLANGLSVVLSEDHRLPIVGATLRYEVGTKDDPSGLTLLIPRMMLRESAHLAEGAYARLLLGAGAVDSTWGVGIDDTTFSVSLPATRWNLALWLWSEQMRFFAGHVDEAQLAKTIALTREDSNRRVSSVTDGALEEVFRRELYPAGHPYHDAPRGLGPSLPSVSVVRAVTERVYVPSRATISLVGDFDSAQVLALAGRYFGGIPAGQPDLRPVPLDHAFETRLEYAANVDLESVSVAYRLPTRLDVAAFLALESALGTGSGSRLSWALEDTVAGAEASFYRRKLNPELRIVLKVRKDRTVDQALAALNVFLGSAGDLSDRTIDRAIVHADMDRELETVRQRSAFNARATALAYPSMTTPTRAGVRAAFAMLRSASQVVAVVRRSPGASVAGELQSRSRTERPALP